MIEVLADRRIADGLECVFASSYCPGPIQAAIHQQPFSECVPVWCSADLGHTDPLGKSEGPLPLGPMQQAQHLRQCAAF
jgi:hypothetical protein